ncbi:MAG: hypothetical protein ACK559_19300 [bacterium]
MRSIRQRSISSRRSASGRRIRRSTTARPEKPPCASTRVSCSSGPKACGAPSSRSCTPSCPAPGPAPRSRWAA